MRFGVKLEKRQNENNFLLKKKKTSSKKVERMESSCFVQKG